MLMALDAHVAVLTGYCVFDVCALVLITLYWSILIVFHQVNF